MRVLQKQALVLALAFCILPSLTTIAQPTTSVAEPKKALKHKIAIGRFSNETRYGKTFLLDANLDPLGKQASDILVAYLQQTGKFLVFERPDLSAIKKEQTRDAGASIVGVDTLILGSVVEFGQTEDGQRGFFNKSKIQKAHAKVAIRLVDVHTGLVFHSAVGQGEATTTTKTILGIGSSSKYDGTLSDKALSVAVEDMLENLVNTLAKRPWRGDVLAVKGSDIFISGGEAQGIRPGDHFTIMRPGEVVKSAQSGFDIPLPPTQLAEIEVVSTFGDSETSQGSVARLVTGSLNGSDIKTLFVSGR